MYTNLFVLVYLDNILIFLKKKDHVQYIQLILRKLQKYRLFVKLSKNLFSIKEIEFFDFIINKF